MSTSVSPAIRPSPRGDREPRYDQDRRPQPRLPGLPPRPVPKQRSSSHPGVSQTAGVSQRQQQHPIATYPRNYLRTIPASKPIQVPYQSHNSQRRHPSTTPRPSTDTPRISPDYYPPLSYIYTHTPDQDGHMSLLAPEPFPSPANTRKPLFTVQYPSWWAVLGKMKVYSHVDERGSINNGTEPSEARQCALIKFHDWPKGKTVVEMGRETKFKFRKRFQSQCGLPGGGPGGMWEWAVDQGARCLVLRSIPHASSGAGRYQHGGVVIARFVASTEDVKWATERGAGWLEILWPRGLTGEQFQEVFVTLVAEMERRRRRNEELNELDDPFNPWSCI